MKKIFLLVFIAVLFGCTPTRHFVNVEKKHNYYQKHRYNTYTSPTWVPGFGILLETRIYRSHKKWNQPTVSQRKRR